MTAESEKIDLVWGIKAIGELIGLSQQQTYHKVRSGQLPVVKRVGESYVVSRSKLVAFFTEDAA